MGGPHRPGVSRERWPPMAVERLKVRCYRRNQLLAVSPTKAGTVVACPKCKAELLIPTPEESPPGQRPADPGPAIPRPESERAPASPSAEMSTFLEDLTAAIPPEVAA